ncbi:putative branched-chain amino acid ABC transporter integral membrane subunit [Frankia canadensis]|uniref:Putative branched-chain amino acid ABC transporter integral membrane subunit n=1 Tax=Frankia canadensis TaxID=1836972 RepID=A0A2I2KM19_9ACTN|nr:branched-chain amino acid ABC transporter permease [Frankia canadensis]SNQ46710.1 putative branched-chain amino acid ABC transporter integral membrane subunit [Frankia canadensis]SOU54000.1 putative branched-chain amino acid ABC transporter integral membrane subunit [Frankia canadensis]
MTIIWTGLALGSLYAVAALLYNVTIATAGVFSFAAAQYLMVGAFIAFFVQDNGLPILLAVPIGAVVGGVLGWLTELAAIRPLKDRTGWAPLVTTVGAGVVLQGLAFAIWGSEPRPVHAVFHGGSINALGGRLQVTDLAMILLGVVLCFGVHLLHTRSPWGLMGRAMTADAVAAAVRGVNTRRLVSGSFVVAGALGGAVGIFVAPKTGAVFSLGSTLVVYAFAALTAGGFGSYVGCWVGGIVIGLVQAHTERYAGSQYPLLVVFALLLVVLLLKPTGLFGDRRIRLV